MEASHITEKERSGPVTDIRPSAFKVSRPSNVCNNWTNQSGHVDRWNLAPYTYTLFPRYLLQTFTTFVPRALANWSSLCSEPRRHVSKFSPHDPVFCGSVRIPSPLNYFQERPMRTRRCCKILRCPHCRVLTPVSVGNMFGFRHKNTSSSSCTDEEKSRYQRKTGIHVRVATLAGSMNGNSHS